MAGFPKVASSLWSEEKLCTHSLASPHLLPNFTHTSALPECGGQDCMADVVPWALGVCSFAAQSTHCLAAAGPRGSC